MKEVMKSKKLATNIATKIPLINREISWLAFNHRVLQEAMDEAVPLVERIKFLGIFSSNMDEFFRVRVAAINRLAHIGRAKRSPLNFQPKKVLSRIKRLVIEQQDDYERIYKEEITKDLANEKIFIINEQQLNVLRGQHVKKYFREKVLSTLVPILLDNVKTFPTLRDKSVYFIILLEDNTQNLPKKTALIEIPTEVLSRFLVLPPTGEMKFIILLDDIIRYCLEDIFFTFNYTNYSAYTIKLTRDAELDFDTETDESYIDNVSKSLKQRKKGKPIRLVYDTELPADTLAELVEKLELKPENLIPGGRYHNFKDFIKFPNVGGAHLEYEKLPALPHPELPLHRSLFSSIEHKDFMVHQPYQSFDYTIHFLREAAIDPNVRSIKITLYRLASDSRIANALINAVKNGKQVTAFVELKARFDEAANIFWAKRMEEEGVKVMYGFADLKIHSKLAIVSRREGDKMVDYAYLSTGNFNENTATLYADHSLFTADKRLSTEVAKVFEYLEKGQLPTNFKHLWVAPNAMRTKMEALIDAEIHNAKKKKPAGIFFKVNSLVDDRMIEKLYEASQAGVHIKLIVRGTCCLVPGKPGFSENIEAISIVDKYLEHARVFVFENGGKPLYFCSSADLMSRNLNRRVEVGFPIYDTFIQKQLKDILDIQWNDNQKARIINISQTNAYRPQKDNKAVRAQVDIYNYLKWI